MVDYEKLGVFYLGKVWDRERGERKEEPLLYDARDLTTHAVCVGMTGSGKTGLGIALLEEAAIDGIPAIAIDPKGDLGNLLLSFPDLNPADFLAWVDPAEALLQACSAQEYAARVAQRWRDGLSDWDQAPARIGRYRNASEARLYTPGSSAGAPVALLDSLTPPGRAVLDDPDALRERVQTAVSGILGLLGIAADPLRSREHILLSNIIELAWQQGRELPLPALVREIQSPPFDRLGVIDLDSFFPAPDRFALAVRLNAVLSSPGFRAWTEGPRLSVSDLLYSPSGRPRLSVLSIAHLDDRERMFFVTMLLNEIVAWMRTQPGTPTLRAILYMDEVFGYLPPVAEPPSKRPLLTLLKQARAFGLGLVLSTQNPVDLDYRALSNAGTWLVGRLQTERDVDRLLDGLSTTSMQGIDRAWLADTIRGLQKRVFLLHNVHDDAPVLFQTRWTLSYLRGPLTREETRCLARSGEPTPAAPGAAPKAPADDIPHAATSYDLPLVPPEIEERFVALQIEPAAGERIVYRPAALGHVRLHYVNAASGVDLWRDLAFLAPIRDDGGSVDWGTSTVMEGEGPPIDRTPLVGGAFAPLPAAALRAESYASWRKGLNGHAYRQHPLRLWKHAELREVSRPGESEGELRRRLCERLREARDLEAERLRAKHAPKLATLQKRIESAEASLAREQSQYGDRKLQTAVSFGATVLGALLGRRLGSAGNVGRATTTARGAGRVLREKEDVTRAEEKLEKLLAERTTLEEEFERQAEALRAVPDPSSLPLEEVRLSARKSDLDVGTVYLAWTPWLVAENGALRPGVREGLPGASALEPGQ